MEQEFERKHNIYCWLPDGVFSLMEYTVSHKDTISIPFHISANVQLKQIPITSSPQSTTTSSTMPSSSVTTTMIATTSMQWVMEYTITVRDANQQSCDYLSLTIPTPPHCTNCVVSSHSPIPRTPV
jgi:hypothetical protein